MSDRNSFDRFFSDGPWTQQMIDEFMRRVENEIVGRRGTRGRITGIRREEYDGTRKTYILDDGNWREVDETPFDFVQTEDGCTMTFDVSAFVDTDDYEASATLNNGILDITFESE